MPDYSPDLTAPWILLQPLVDGQITIHYAPPDGLPRNVSAPITVESWRDDRAAQLAVDQLLALLRRTYPPESAS